MQLVEEATEGCWIGHRARMATSGEIGSVYSPPKQGGLPAAGRSVPQVETVVDIEYNPTVSIPCRFNGYQATHFVPQGLVV